MDNEFASNETFAITLDVVKEIYSDSRNGLERISHDELTISQRTPVNIPQINPIDISTGKKVLIGTSENKLELEFGGAICTYDKKFKCNFLWWRWYEVRTYYDGMDFP